MNTGMQHLQMSSMGDAAASLYDGGWRAADREQLIDCYALTEDEADKIAELLDEYESADSLYDGGWRAADRERLIGRYALTEAEADAICELLEKLDADRE
jgi:hypothetical protein